MTCTTKVANAHFEKCDQFSEEMKLDQISKLAFSTELLHVQPTLMVRVSCPYRDSSRKAIAATGQMPRLYRAPARFFEGQKYKLLSFTPLLHRAGASSSATISTAAGACPYRDYEQLLESDM